MNVWNYISLELCAICVLMMCTPLQGGPKEYFAALAKCPPCTEESMGKVLHVCLEEGQTLSNVDHEEQRNGTIVCNAFESLLVCVAKKVPQCIETMGEKYISYTMTPWDCQMNARHVDMFQNYAKVGCERLAHEAAKAKEEETNYSIQNSSGQSKLTSEANTTLTNGTNTANAFHEPSALRLSIIHFILLWSGLLLL